MKPALILALATALIAAPGCGSPSDPPAARGSSTHAAPPSTECHAELETIARCLHAAVSEIQEEPESTDTIRSFLVRASAAVASADMPDPCAQLRLGDQTETLALSDGSPVRVTRSEDIDELEDNLTVMHISYRFESATCDRSAETTLELQMGGGH